MYSVLRTTTTYKRCFVPVFYFRLFDCDDKKKNNNKR